MTVAGKANFIGEIEVSGFHDQLLRAALGEYRRFHFIVLQTVEDPFFNHRAVCIEMDTEGRGNSSEDSIDDLCHGLLMALRAAYTDCGEDVEKFRSRITERVPNGPATDDGVVAAYYQECAYLMPFAKRMEFISIQNDQHEKVEAVFEPVNPIKPDYKIISIGDGVTLSVSVWTEAA